MLNRVPPLRGCKLWRSAPHRFTVGYGVTSLRDFEKLRETQRLGATL